MKNEHPVVTATSSSYCSPVDPDSATSNASKEPIIRLKLDKPLHWDWELTTTADNLPVIQLLDKDGRLLVETTGRTAQRARGSFREGLKSHEEFGNKGKSLTDRTSTGSFNSSGNSSSTGSNNSTVVPQVQGNRIVDGFSTKFGSLEYGFRPRKCRSDASVTKLATERRTKKRHSTCLESQNAKGRKEEGEGNGEGSMASTKKYSAGDFLRRQILDDLRTRSTLGKSPKEVAKERCKKVKAYLRSQSDVLPTLTRPREDLGEEEEEEDEEKKENYKDSSSTREKDNLERDRRKDVDEEKLRKIKNFLSQKLREKMKEEKEDGNSNNVDFSAKSASRVIKKRHSDRYWHEEERGRQRDRKGYRTRKVRSETSVIRFAPEVLLELEKSESSRSMGRENFRSSNESLERRRSKLRQQDYRRSRSDNRILEHPEIAEERKWRQALKRESSEKRKVYRKTKSDILLGQIDSSVDSEKDLADYGKQDNVERSWREYKERKKLERLHRDTERDEGGGNRQVNEVEEEEEDFMKKPRWKDLQNEFCSAKSCRVCLNLKNCVNPRRNGKGESQEEEEKRNSVLGDKKSEEESSSSWYGRRPGTSLQENYLYVDPRRREECRNSVAEVRVKDRKNVDHLATSSSSSSNLVSPDFGYNSIPKSAFKDYRDLYARSNVKKSDTFKIVDASEEPEEEEEEEEKKKNATRRELEKKASRVAVDEKEEEEEEEEVVHLTNKSNEDIAKDYFKRVYELLKRRQEEARMVAEGVPLPGYDDSSSSNYVEEIQKRRPRRKRKDAQGEEIVAVPPNKGLGGGGGGNEKSQRLLLNEEATKNNSDRRRRSSHLQNICKRTRPAPPLPPAPPVISCRINAKDIGKYFDWPNKENTPRNGVVNFPSAYCEGEVEEERKREEKETGEKDEEKKRKKGEEIEEEEEEEGLDEMGSNLSRHNGKGLTGRRTQSSGNLCEPKGKFNGMGKILVPCSSTQRERRYKFCGSLPNHLDDKDVLDDDPRENNNIMTDTISGNLGGTLPHKKRSLGVHFSDGGPTGTLDLVKHRSQDSLDENDPWRYQQSDLDLVRCRHGNFDSVRRNRSADTVASSESTRRYTRGSSTDDRCQRNSDLDLVGTLPKRRQDHPRSSAKSIDTNSSSAHFVTFDSASDDDLLMRVLHKPDCELMKHRQQLNKCSDLKLPAKFAGNSGEPQDQGYASERSPEDEHPPSLPGQPFPAITSGGRERERGGGAGGR